MRRLIFGSLAFIIAATLTTSASAGNGLPLTFSERPLTLPTGNWSIIGKLTLEKRPNIDDMGVMFDAGVDYGITDDLTVGAEVLPLHLSPGDAMYGDPTVHATYRLMRTAVELGAYIGVTIPVREHHDLVLTLGVPVKLGLTKTTSLNTGLFFPIQFADPDTLVGLQIPVEFILSATPNFFIRVVSGFNILKIDVAETALIPLGAGVGYTIANANNGPLVDLSVDFTLPSFIAPSAPTGSDTVTTDHFQIIVGGVVHL